MKYLILLLISFNINAQPIFLPKLHGKITVNLLSYQLIYHDNNNIRIFPVVVGDVGWETPTGSKKITSKIKDPDWYPPESIRKEYWNTFHEIMPTRIAAGRYANPLGPRKMRLDYTNIFIHGDGYDKPFTVGKADSHGCIRMTSPDVKILFDLVTVGDTVNIVKDPILIGHDNNYIYIKTLSNNLPMKNEITLQIIEYVELFDLKTVIDYDSVVVTKEITKIGTIY